MRNKKKRKEEREILHNYMKSLALQQNLVSSLVKLMHEKANIHDDMMIGRAVVPISSQSSLQLKVERRKKIEALAKQMVEECEKQGLTIEEILRLPKEFEREILRNIYRNQKETQFQISQKDS